MTPLTDKVSTHFLLGDNMLLSFIDQSAGAVFPVHAHDCEQALVILEGSVEHIVDGQEIHMEAGDVCVHPVARMADTPKPALKASTSSRRRVPIMWK